MPVLKFQHIACIAVDAGNYCIIALVCQTQKLHKIGVVVKRTVIGLQHFVGKSAYGHKDRPVGENAVNALAHAELVIGKRGYYHQCRCCGSDALSALAELVDRVLYAAYFLIGRKSEALPVVQNFGDRQQDKDVYGHRKTLDDEMLHDKKPDKEVIEAEICKHLRFGSLVLPACEICGEGEYHHQCRDKQEHP